MEPLIENQAGHGHEQGFPEELCLAVAEAHYVNVSMRKASGTEEHFR